MSQKPNHDAKNIGARFRSARSLVPNLNRKSFCERYEINRYTMQSWENGLHVSKGKNVEKFIEALAREGVFCTSEWLFDGTGEPARPLKGPNGEGAAIITEEVSDDLSDQLRGLIDTLREGHQQFSEELVVATVNDDAMAPKFMRGDTVMAVRTPANKDRLHQKYCIVELTPERTIVRKVLVSKDNLILLALDDRTAPMTLGHQINAYEILWHLMNQ